MLKSKLIISALVILLAGTAAFAQPRGMQGGQMQQQQQMNIDVSDAELEKFASAAQTVQVENQKAQQKMQKVLQDNGLSVQKFQQISRAQQNPNSESNASDKEMKSFNKASKKIQTIQQKTNKKMEKIIKDEGLTLQRYRKIGMAMRSDQELQQRLQKKMGAGQGQQRQMPQGGGR